MRRSFNYATLPTEQPNSRSRHLDRLSVEKLLRLMNREDASVPRAIARAISKIERAVLLIVTAFRRGGRLFFIGAGTSGRLGVLEAAECPPTFNTPPSMVQAVMAGGRPAVFRSREGAEDNQQDARQTVRRRVRSGDVVVGIAASGVTPFVDAALQEARRLGAKTVLVSCHPHARLRRWVHVLIAPRVGPELIAGSTRLKAGTATKLILNMLTVASMVKLGKVYGNLMVDVRPSSRKLQARAIRIIQQVGGVSSDQAARCLRAAGGNTKVAIVMATQGLTSSAARHRLAQAKGSLHRTLQRL